MEHVNKVADVAGVCNRKGMVQELSYSNNWMKEDFKLIELPQELLTCLKEGDEVIIRGDTDDDSVLCTESATYDLRAADTSNSLLIVPELSNPKSNDFINEPRLVKRDVCSCFFTYFEVKKTRPRTQRLRSLLEENSFNDKDNTEEEMSKERFTTDDLLGLIQASKSELLQSLQAMGALQIDGYWRILDISYQEKAFAQALALVEEKSWDWKEVPVKTSCDILEELYPSFVISHCLHLYGEVLADTEEQTVCLSEEKVSTFYAEYILRPAGKFNYQEFMEAWAQSVPDGMTVKQEHLKGIALKDENSVPPVIWHFPERDLPEDTAERFNVLFKERTKWRHDDIEPYIKGILAPGQALNALFLKYTRSATDEKGSKVYSSKRPVK